MFLVLFVCLVVKKEGYLAPKVTKRRAVQANALK
jgi:hypothetical protein